MDLADFAGYDGDGYRSEEGVAVCATRRLQVRPFAASDLGALGTIVSDSTVMRFVGDGQPLSSELTARWIATASSRAESGLPTTYAVTLAGGGALVGWGGVVPSSTLPGDLELVFGLAVEHWGKGLGSELVSALAALAADRFDARRLVATVDPANEASLRILAHLGFQPVEDRYDENGLPERLLVMEPVRVE